MLVICLRMCESRICLSLCVRVIRIKSRLVNFKQPSSVFAAVYELFNFNELSTRRQIQHVRRRACVVMAAASHGLHTPGVQQNCTHTYNSLKIGELVQDMGVRITRSAPE